MNTLHRRTLWTALLTAVSALLIRAAMQPFELQNDDLQIYFMLLNGGCADGGIGFGLYTNYVLGRLIAQVSYLLPQLNVYLCCLMLFSFIACVSVNFFVLERQTGGSAVRRVLVFCVLLLINIVCLGNLQYTHVGVWCACAGALQLGGLRADGAWLRAATGVFLLLAAFCLRSSALLPALFIGGTVLLSGRSEGAVEKHFNRTLTLGAVAACLLIGVFAAVNEMAYRRAPEWDEARTYLRNRVAILDSADNSGVDKTEQLAAAGIDPQAFRLFRSFIYTPAMADTASVEQAVPIHRAGRRGLFGSDYLAERGFLAAGIRERIGGGLTPLQRLTPWTPLLLSIGVWLLTGTRSGCRRAVCMVLAVAAYTGVLFLYMRMVGRVLDPVLYAAAAWFMALPAARRTRFTESVCALAGLCACLFFVRHWRVSHPTDTPVAYCAAHPETLYFTTCQQGFGLFPRGLCGYSAAYMSRCNVLPVSDGWSFYSPAYRAAMAARGCENPWQMLLKGNARLLITGREEGRSRMLQRMGEAVFTATGQNAAFTRTDSVGCFEVVRADAAQ